MCLLTCTIVTEYDTISNFFIFVKRKRAPLNNGLNRNLDRRTGKTGSRRVKIRFHIPSSSPPPPSHPSLAIHHPILPLVVSLTVHKLRTHSCNTMEVIALPPVVTSEKKIMPTNDQEVIKYPRDSLIVHIPLNVTADLGVAMKRVRAKRIAQYKQLQPNIVDTQVEEVSQPIVKDGDKSDQESDEDASQEKRTKEKQDDSMMDTIGSEVRREQFCSTVDYLEAKYAKGVMIHDLDERIREKKKKNDGGEDMSVLSDSEAGSCYSENSGQFIDDSDLRTDVAHQILASSAFGTTKIEAEAAKAKGADDDSLGANDHAFFVNVGDLEMEDGWNDEIEEDQDWLSSMKKSKG